MLDVSAVKCVNCFDMCGYCDICTGYFELNYIALDTAAENQMCPTGAIDRKFVEEQIRPAVLRVHDRRPLCIGCGKCVKGCALMNGSLYLQVEHDRCLNCNECSIAMACPTQAFHRVPAEPGRDLEKPRGPGAAPRGERLRQTAGDDADAAARPSSCWRGRRSNSAGAKQQQRLDQRQQRASGRPARACVEGAGRHPGSPSPPAPRPKGEGT